MEGRARNRRETRRKSLGRPHPKRERPHPPRYVHTRSGASTLAVGCPQLQGTSTLQKGGVHTCRRGRPQLHGTSTLQKGGVHTRRGTSTPQKGGVYIGRGRPHSLGPPRLGRTPGPASRTRPLTPGNPPAVAPLLRHQDPADTAPRDTHTALGGNRGTERAMGAADSPEAGRRHRRQRRELPRPCSVQMRVRAPGPGCARPRRLRGHRWTLAV